MNDTERQEQRARGDGIPPVTAWIGAALSIFMIVLALIALTGCKAGLQDPCRHHGGIVSISGGTYHCGDGSEV